MTVREFYVLAWAVHIFRGLTRKGTGTSVPLILVNVGLLAHSGHAGVVSVESTIFRASALVFVTLLVFM
jgi:hypothetical protein